VNRQDLYLARIANAKVRRTGTVETRSDGSVVISSEQRTKHVVFEAAALLVAAPFSFWLAGQRYLPMWARVLAGVTGVVTVYVDGSLLWSFLTEKKK
jgi:hypothetical protein